MNSVCLPSPRHDEEGQLHQQLPPVANRLQGSTGVLDQSVCLCSRGLEAVEGRVGRFGVGLISPGGFSEGCLITHHVENVVDNLEGKTYR